VTSPDVLPSEAPPARDFFTAALLNLRDTVKWMIAAASAVAAVLVAGLQLKDLGDIAGSSAPRFAGAVAAAAVALLLVLSVIASAVRVLAVPRLSARDLSDRELQGDASALQVRLEPHSDKVVQRLLERRTYLLGRHDSINEFYRDYVATLVAYEHLAQGRVARLGDREFDPRTEEDRTALASLARQARHNAERLESAAQLVVAEMRFQRLAGQLSWGGVVFAAAVLSFAWLASTNDAGATVIKPTPVQIYVRDVVKTGLPGSCHATELYGIAIGGTFTQPSVVTEAAPGCPSTVIIRGAGIVVVPIVTSGDRGP
jgi:hypothetical protein